MSNNGIGIITSKSVQPLSDEQRMELQSFIFNNHPGDFDRQTLHGFADDTLQRLHREAQDTTSERDTLAQFINAYAPVFNMQVLLCMNVPQLKHLQLLVRASLPSFMTIDCETVQVGDTVQVWFGLPSGSIDNVRTVIDLDGSVLHGDMRIDVRECYAGRLNILQAAIDGTLEPISN